MRVVLTHTDLRLYWPARIAALRRALEGRGDELFVVEIAGAGSNYAFAGHVVDPEHGGGSEHGDCIGAGALRDWICLFPKARMEDIPPVQASRKLLDTLSMLDADVILSGSFAYPSGAAAMYWAKRNARSVVQFDDIRPEDVPRNRLVNYVKRLLYREVDAILCPAPSWTEGFLRWGFKAEQLFFGVDVVDNDFWGRELEDAGEGDGVQLGGGFGELGGGLGELGGGEMDRGPIVVEAGRSLGRGTFLLAVGRQIPAKNFIFLLEVYERYREALEQRGCLPLVLIGEGPERRAMESFIRSRALEGVHFFPFAGPERLRLFYRYAAALVLPSRLETWGLVVNEAMAAGLPVLVSKACGCASVLVEEGLNGYTFSPYNQEQLLDILLRFTGKEPAARAAMGRTSKEIVRSWGLDQFVKGSLQAIDYAATHRKKTKSIQARFVLKNWKGRYRPV